jgi:type IV pilus assembly protein PilB
MADNDREVEELQNVLRLQVPNQPQRLPLGALLLGDGAITAEQLERALAEVELRGCRLGQVLVEHGWLTQRDLAAALARQAELPFVDLNVIKVDTETAMLLPEPFAQRYSALPIRFLGEDTVQVAVADPTNVLASDDLRLALGLNVELVVVEAAALDRAIQAVYHPQLAAAGRRPDNDLLSFGVSDDIATNAPAIKLVNQIIDKAVEISASDIHFEPQARELLVRMRVDGVMRKLTSVPLEQQAAVTSRLKIMGELDIAERRAPQDGRISYQLDGHGMDIRIAVMPTTYGEQVVLRLLHRRTGPLGLADLGMGPVAQEALERAITQPYGAVIACGPTGSGKTTTLYAALDLLNDSERVVMTVEDPVEYQIPGLNQIEVNVKAGLTFARGLRTILRSDPDVLLVGEVRDDETAAIAIQAAMTGHLVLTSLHTHNAAASIERLMNMRVESSLVASSVNCIVAQRLARRLCHECREAYHADRLDLPQLGLAADADDVVLFRPRGCIRCAGTGYRGRVALYEVMTIHGKLRRLIGGSTEDLFAAAVEQGMTTLRQDGMRLVREGVSSLDEIRRVTGDRLV